MIRNFMEHVFALLVVFVGVCNGVAFMIHAASASRNDVPICLERNTRFSYFVYGDDLACWLKEPLE